MEMFIAIVAAGLAVLALFQASSLQTRVRRLEAQLEAGEAPVRTRPVNACRRCTAVLLDGDRFCPECGMPVVAAPTPRRTNKPRAAKVASVAASTVPPPLEVGIMGADLTPDLPAFLAKGAASPPRERS